MNQNDKIDIDRNIQSATTIASGLYGAEIAAPDAAATDSMLEGMDLFRVAAKKLGAVEPKISQGNLFEYIEAAKFNADAAAKGSSLKATVTAANNDPHGAADILIENEGGVVGKVQAKSMNELSKLTHAISDTKYRGMQKLVPDEKAGRVRELASKRAETGSLKAEEYKDTAKNVTGQLKSGRVSSEGTSYRESLWAAKNPKLYATMTEAKYVAREASITGVNAALASSIVSGLVSGVKYGIQAHRDEITVEEAIALTAKDAGKSGLRGGLTGAGSTIIRYGATKVGIKALDKSNLAVGLAAGTIDVGVSIYRLAKGEITPEEASEQIGQTGSCTAYSLYTGAAAGAVFGPIGAVAGSIIGYLVTASVYQSAIAIFKEARLTEAEAERTIAICQRVCQAMAEQRAEFERLFKASFEMRCAEFENCFIAIETALAIDNPELATQSLSNFAALFGKKLQFETFEEFDDFMLDSTRSLAF